MTYNSRQQPAHLPFFHSTKTRSLIFIIIIICQHAYLLLFFSFSIGELALPPYRNTPNRAHTVPITSNQPASPAFSKKRHSTHVCSSHHLLFVLEYICASGLLACQVVSMSIKTTFPLSAHIFLSLFTESRSTSLSSWLVCKRVYSAPTSHSIYQLDCLA